ncbi:hypothetical protein V6N13_094706 [Hibiscus sabdariffa]
MELLSDFIDILGLVDLPLHGGRFTWSNFRDTPAFSRLDRFLIDPEVLRIWPDLIQSILPRSISDHNPMCLATIGNSWGPRPFKWSDHLLEDNAYIEKVQDECSSASGIGIVELLRKCKCISKVWAETKGGNSAVTIHELEKECDVLEKELQDGNKADYLCEILKISRRKLWEAVVLGGFGSWDAEPL